MILHHQPHLITYHSINHTVLPHHTHNYMNNFMNHTFLSHSMNKPLTLQLMNHIFLNFLILHKSTNLNLISNPNPIHLTLNHLIIHHHYHPQINTQPIFYLYKPKTYCNIKFPQLFKILNNIQSFHSKTKLSQTLSQNPLPYHHPNQHLNQQIILTTLSSQ